MYYNWNKLSLRVYFDFKVQSRSIPGKYSKVLELKAIKAMVQCKAWYLGDIIGNRKLHNNIDQGRPTIPKIL